MGWKHTLNNRIKKCVELGLLNQIQWKGHGNETPVRNIYQTLRNKGDQDPYADAIWASIVSKMAVALWKLTWDRMATFDRIKLQGWVDFRKMRTM